MGNPNDRQHPRQVRMTDAEHAATVRDAAVAGFERADGQGDFSKYVRHLVARNRKLLERKSVPKSG